MRTRKLVQVQEKEEEQEKEGKEVERFGTFSLRMHPYGDRAPLILILFFLLHLHRLLLLIEWAGLGVLPT